MKIKRYKKAKRYLSFYRSVYNFWPPYQILVDSTFCQTCIKKKIDIKEQISKYLMDKVNLLTTVCVVEEIENLSKKYKFLLNAMFLCKTFPVHKCGHEKNPISASQCLFSLLQQSKDHYFLASQDPDLIKKVGHLNTVPILLIKFNIIVLDKPKNMIQKYQEYQEDLQQSNDYQLETLKKLKKIELHDHKSEEKNKQEKTSKFEIKKIDDNSLKQTKPDKKIQIKKSLKKRIPNHIKRMFDKIEKELIT